MSSYYRDKLSAERLRKCYEIAPPRVRQYLRAEVDHLLQRIHPGDTVLELGCGYGRILPQLAENAGLVIGVDTSIASLLLEQKVLRGLSDCHTVNMDAVRMGFFNGTFDRVLCIQNGMSAFHVDVRGLLQESMRVTRVGGLVLFSSYADKFWEDRLDWFRIQSENGLLGEIDWGATGRGTIVCKDGFTASTYGPDDFASLMSQFDVPFQIREVDNSSVFCEISV